MSYQDVVEEDRSALPKFAAGNAARNNRKYKKLYSPEQIAHAEFLRDRVADIFEIYYFGM